MKSIAQLLVKNEIVKTNFTDPFTWTSGIKSPIYCDCRELIGSPEAREVIINTWIDYIKTENIPCDVIAGTATAGIPWAAFVADRLKKPMLYVRSKPKGHGAGKMVEGLAIRDQHVLVIEDAFSTAGSSIKSAHALQTELNATVTDIMGIFSWDTPLAQTNATEANLKLHPLTLFNEIIDALFESEKISQSEKESLEKFKANPSEWKVSE